MGHWAEVLLPIYSLLSSDAWRDAHKFVDTIVFGNLQRQQLEVRDCWPVTLVVTFCIVPCSCLRGSVLLARCRHTHICGCACAKSLTSCETTDLTAGIIIRWPRFERGADTYLRTYSSGHTEAGLGVGDAQAGVRAGDGAGAGAAARRVLRRLWAGRQEGVAVLRGGRRHQRQARYLLADAFACFPQQRLSFGSSLPCRTLGSTPTVGASVHRTLQGDPAVRAASCTDKRHAWYLRSHPVAPSWRVG